MIEHEWNKYKSKSERIAATVPDQLGLIWRINVASFEEFESTKLAKIFTLTKVSEVHVDVALLYARKLVHRLATRPHLTSQGYYGYFIGCLLLASKFLDDITFKNNSWSLVSGISLPEINQIEQNVLLTLEFCLFVTNEDIAMQRKRMLQDVCARQRERLVNEIMSEKMFSLDF